MKGAIFDLDGTLMDSMGVWAGMWKQFLYEHQLTPPPHFTQDITPLGMGGTAEYIRRMGLRMEAAEIVATVDRRMHLAYAQDILPKPFVPEYLNKLLSEGVTLCVLTASSQYNVLPCLARTGLLDKFAFTCSCDDIGMKKSDPAIYAFTAERLGVPLSDIAFFDDNLGALTAARAAGVYTVGVYDESSDADRPQIEATVDRFITSFSELL